MKELGQWMKGPAPKHPPRKPEPPKPIPDAAALVKELDKLQKAFNGLQRQLLSVRETIRSGGIPPKRTDSLRTKKLKSEAAKQRWALVPVEKRKTYTAKARARKRGKSAL